MRRADATTALLRAPVPLIHAHVGRHGRVPRLRTRPLAAPARPDGHRDGGGRLPVRDPDRRRGRHVQPPAVADHRLHRHGRRLDGRRPRLRAVADHRALGVLGPLVHVHERRLRGLDHRRGRRREHRQACSCRGSRISYVGRRRRAASCRSRSGVLLAPGRRHRRRRGHGRWPGCSASSSCRRPASGGGRAPSARPRCRSSARRPRQAPASRGLSAGGPAPGRRRALHGHVERGLRPAEGGSLPARRRPAGRRAASTRSSGSASSGSPGWCSASSRSGG